MLTALASHGFAWRAADEVIVSRAHASFSFDSLHNNEIVSARRKDASE